MTSYASVAAYNAPPPSEQPRPDPALLNTEQPSLDNVADDAAKINIVSPLFKQDPHTTTSQARLSLDNDQGDLSEPQDHPPKSRKKKFGKKPHPEVHSVWDSAKRYLFCPGIAGCLVGLVNVGFLASVGRVLYTQPHLRRDVPAISAIAGGTITFLFVENIFVERYRQTSQGQKGEKIVKERGDFIFRHLHEQLLRPQVVGGFLGIVNATILGALGYLTYTNWERPWNKRVVSLISVGLLTLSAGEGFAMKKYYNKT